MEVNTLADLAAFNARGEEFFADVMPPVLDERHCANARCFPSREAVLPHLSQVSRCVEIGTQSGYFAKLIHEIVKPAEFHIIDLNYDMFDHEFFADSVANRSVILHEGDSGELLSRFEDRSFDLLYVDGDHSYAGVKRDLDQCVRLVTDNGLIMCNDYTVFSPFEGCKYGVCRAVNEVCIEQGFEITHFAFSRWGYHDVALRRIT